MPGSERCVGRDDCHEMKVTCPLLTLGKLISVVVSKSVLGNWNGEDDFSVEWKPIQVARRIRGQLRLGSAGWWSAILRLRGGMTSMMRTFGGVLE
jgi:hypothetical protein